MSRLTVVRAFEVVVLIGCSEDCSASFGYAHHGHELIVCGYLVRDWGSQEGQFTK